MTVRSGRQSADLEYRGKFPGHIRWERSETSSRRIAIGDPENAFRGDRQQIPGDIRHVVQRPRPPLDGSSLPRCWNRDLVFLRVRSSGKLETGRTILLQDRKLLVHYSVHQSIWYRLAGSTGEGVRLNCCSGLSWPTDDDPWRDSSGSLFVILRILQKISFPVGSPKGESISLIPGAGGA
jgi:hypothetical protein